jgi:hypothetical protein
MDGPDDFLFADTGKDDDAVSHDHRSGMAFADLDAEQPPQLGRPLPGQRDGG